MHLNQILLLTLRSEIILARSNCAKNLEVSPRSYRRKCLMPKWPLSRTDSSALYVVSSTPPWGATHTPTVLGSGLVERPLDGWNTWTEALSAEKMQLLKSVELLCRCTVF